MVKIIMHGCNGHMGQVISGLVEKDPDAEVSMWQIRERTATLYIQIWKNVR